MDHKLTENKSSLPNVDDIPEKRCDGLRPIGSKSLGRRHPETMNKKRHLLGTSWNLLSNKIRKWRNKITAYDSQFVA